MSRDLAFHRDEIFAVKRETWGASGQGRGRESQLIEKGGGVCFSGEKLVCTNARHPDVVLFVRRQVGCTARA